MSISCWTRKQTVFSITLVWLLMFGVAACEGGSKSAPEVPVSCSGPVPPRPAIADQLIAFTRSGTLNGSDVFVVDTDGTNLRQLTDEFPSRSPAWSPDGTLLAITGIGDAKGILVVDADGTNLRQIVNAELAGYDPAWSPDGTRIAFTRSGDAKGILVVDADGTNLRQIVNAELAGYDPVWSPDGTRIAFTAMDVDEASDDTSVGAAISTEVIGLFASETVREPTAVFVIDVDGHNLRKLATGYDPVWSPDSTRIAFANSGIFIIGTDSNELPNLLQASVAVRHGRLMVAV